MTNPLDTLGLKEPVSALDVEQAFRRLALKYHPDHSDHPNAVVTMRALIEARAKALKNCPKVVFLEALDRTVIAPALGAPNAAAARALARLINADPDSPITIRVH